MVCCGSLIKDGFAVTIWEYLGHFGTTTSNGFCVEYFGKG